MHCLLCVWGEGEERAENCALLLSELGCEGKLGRVRWRIAEDAAMLRIMTMMCVCSHVAEDAATIVCVRECTQTQSFRLPAC